MNLSLGQRRRMLREINTEFDVIIDRIAQESGNNPKAFVGSCEMKYPLRRAPGKSAVFCHAAGKPDLAPILMHRLNQGETAEEAIARRNTEQHRLADRSGSTPVPGFRKTAVPAGSSGKHRGFWSVRRISSCRQRSPFPRR